jgi:hypothetical protein
MLFLSSMTDRCFELSAWLTDTGSGYGQQGFKTRCCSCRTIVTKEAIAIRRLINELKKLFLITSSRLACVLCTNILRFSGQHLFFISLQLLPPHSFPCFITSSSSRRRHKPSGRLHSGHRRSLELVQPDGILRSYL